MGWQATEEREDVDVADWIRDRLHPFARDVGSVVPPGFAAYARVFHPATLARASLDGAEVEVTWAEVASWNGKAVHSEMQFHALGGPWHRQPHALGPKVHEPRAGVLPARQCSALVSHLTKHTSTPDRCWFCLWDGYGDLQPGGSVMQFVSTEPDKPPPPTPEPRYPEQKRRVRLPNRDYLLFKGSVDQAAGWMEGPNLWWPDDREWCVASEIDLPYTYVGGSSALIEDILADGQLEALPSAITDGITAYSDTINAP